MRVTVDEDLTFYYDLVPYSVSKGMEVEGTAAVHLLKTGAAVTPADDDARAFIAVGDTEEAPVPQDNNASELDISAKINDVLAWVGDDQERALEAHAAEEAKGDKARTRLLARLEEIATGDQSPADDGEISDSED